MPEITIRPYCEADWPTLVSIHDPARKNELEQAGLSDAFLPLEIAAEREGLFDYTVVVAEAEGKVRGFAAYTPDELAWLYVSVDYSHRGIGRALTKYVIENTHERPLCLEALLGNRPAFELYKSVGFELKEIVSGRMPGNESFTVTVWCMELK